MNLPKLRENMLRFDTAILEKFEKTPSGGLKIPGTLTKTGIFTYTNPDGTQRREYRPAEEVFSDKVLNTFRGAPVTVGHPGLVTPANWKQVAIGHVGEQSVRQDGPYMAADLYIEDATAIAKIEGRGLVEISNGYEVDLDETPGEVDGQRYDAVQRNIRGNHVALLPVGRGRVGRDVKLRLDTNGNEENYTGNVMPESTTEKSVPSKVKVDASEVNIRVDGQPEIDRLTAENEMLKAKVAEQAGQLADHSRLDSLVQERVELVNAAKKVLGDKWESKGKSAKQIKSEVIAQKNPKLKLDSASDDYINAAFDMALSLDTPPHPSLSQVRQDTVTATTVENPIDAAAKKNREASQNAWKQPLSFNR